MNQQFSLFDPTPPAAPTFTGALIYEPKGRAREYAALACNTYRGCDHRCSYCYAPSACQVDRQDFGNPQTRAADFLVKLEREARKAQAAGVTTPVHLCFTCDPYQHLDAVHGITRQAIAILHRYGLPVQVLTKGGRRALRDLDLFTPADAFATTLTLLDPGQSVQWEPGAALPADRIATIREFHAAGIPTWVSLEPVLDPAVALTIIEQIHAVVDIFKIGRLNYHPLAQTIDWRAWALNSTALLRSLGYQRNPDPDSLRAGQFYVKRDLAAYLA